MQKSIININVPCSSRRPSTLYIYVARSIKRRLVGFNVYALLIGEILKSDGTGSSSCIECSNMPSNATFDDGYTGQTSNSCPWTCSVGFYPPVVGLQNRQRCLACSNAPDHAVYSGAGTAIGFCPWQCEAGFFKNNTMMECSACRVGSYSSAQGAG